MKKSFTGFLNKLKFQLAVVLGIAILFLCNPLLSEATHISGADITYKYVSGNTYQLSLTLYRDCAGIAAPNAVGVNYSSVSCSFNGTVNLSKLPGTGKEISHVCSTAVTTCRGGVLPGIQKYEYVGNVTLPMQCSDWIFGYSVCCRNCAISTLSYTPNNCNGVPGTYVEATLNNLFSTNNSAPVFTNIPVAFFCIGQTFHYNHGADDPDGDSLVYSMVTPRSAPGTFVSFKPGFSATNPISSSPAITLDNTGDIVLNPTQVEVGVMTIMVKEYRNGILIGSVLRDMEVYTQSCSNALPIASGANGSTNYDLIACPGKQLTFNINSTDPNSNQNVKMNYLGAIAGATFNSTVAQFPVGTFSWTPTLAQARNQPYTFLLTVQDDNCPFLGFQTYSFSVLVPPLSATIFPTNATCAIPGNGSASINAIGFSPFQYQWSVAGNTTSSLTGLSAGNYSCLVSDRYGCTLNSSITIGAPPVLSLTNLSQNNISCFGQSNGSIFMNASGGVAPLVYSWTPAISSNLSATNLAPGNYQCIVTDANGCTKTFSTTLTQPPLLTHVMNTPVNLSCYNVNIGEASVIASGGTAPYQYYWLPGNFTTASLTNLAAGNYQAIITDAKGCSTGSSISISQPPLLNATVSSTPALCGVNNGNVKVIPTGGVQPYTYNWTPGNYNSDNYSNLSPGTYNVRVTDANGCVTNSSTNVSAIPSPVATINSFSNVTCYNGNNGSASVNIVGGTAPFDYQWSPRGGNNTTATQLSSGVYSVRVTDANGCSTVTSINIVEPSRLIAFPSSTIGTCGSSNGSASVVVQGGVPPYSYRWSSGVLGASVLNNLPAGSYSVNITDANSCLLNTIVNVQNTGIMNAVLSNTTAPNCFGGNDATATVAVTGGTAPYTYLWSPGNATQNTAAGLEMGRYDVMITDANSCMSILTVMINEPPELLVSTSACVATNCFGAVNGRPQVDVSGGVPPYSYSWAGHTDVTPYITNQPAGTYTVTVTDSHGCTVVGDAVVDQPSRISIGATTSSSTCGASNGSASVTTSGGVSPYTYSWYPSGSTATQINNLPAGIYSVTITDNHGCLSTASVGVSNIAGPIATINSIVPVSCFGGADGSAKVSLSGGTAPFNYSWSYSTANTNSISGLPVGTYNVMVTDGNNCVTTVPFNISSPSILNAALVATPTLCNGSSDGQAAVNTSGGVMPYTYLWSNGNTTQSLTQIPSGNYSVVVKDANGCSNNINTTVNQPSQIAATTNVTNVNCFGAASGNALVIPSGGVGNYTYNWSNGQSSQLATNLSAGNYSVAITDGNGCRYNQPLVISQPTAISSIEEILPASCSTASNGSIKVSVAGGVRPYNYSWTPAATNDSLISNLVKGNYQVIVTDANGCTMSKIYSVNAPSQLSVTSNVQSALCYNANNGSATLSSSGGTTPYSYLWSNGNTTSSVSGLFSGNYFVTVTDQNGCAINQQVQITQPVQLVTTVSTPIPICVGQTVALSAAAQGGNPAYTFHWSNSIIGASQSLSPTSTTDYSVYAIDANGCKSTPVPVRITVNPSLFSSAVGSDTICEGDNASVFVNVSGGNGGPYTYLWNNGSTISSIFVSPKNTQTYTVSISDNCGTSPIQQQVTVFVNPKPNAEFSPYLISGCPSLKVDFNAQGNSVPLSSQYWQFGDGYTDTSVSPTHYYTTPGIYSVVHTVTSTQGCKAIWSQPANVFVSGKPVADFMVSTENPSIINPSVSFTDLSIDPVYWKWSFGDGDSATIKNPQHMYRDTGVYNVKLIVQNAKMCFDTIQKIITIKNEFVIYFPNTFTPNDDGVNDRFRPLGLGVVEFKMLIFDRWGECIFTTSDMQKGWDGNKQGSSEKCGLDTYVYLAVATDDLGIKHEYKGQVNLLY